VQKTNAESKSKREKERTKKPEPLQMEAGGKLFSMTSLGEWMANLITVKITYPSSSAWC